MLHFSRLILVVFCILFSQKSIAEPHRPIGVWSTPASFASYSQDFDKVGPVRNYHALTLNFGTIQGQLFGMTTGDYILVVDKLEKDGFNLTLPSEIRADYQILSSNMLDVSPRNTRIARLSTTHAFDDGSSSGGGGFVDARTGNIIVLAYVSQPVSIVGKQIQRDDQDNQYIYRYNLHLKKSGWNWIKVNQRSKHVFDLSAAEKDIQPEFAVIFFDKETI